MKNNTKNNIVFFGKKVKVKEHGENIKADQNEQGFILENSPLIGLSDSFQ